MGLSLRAKLGNGAQPGGKVRDGAQPGGKVWRTGLSLGAP